MAVSGATIAAQIGAAAGLWTHTAVDWRGNEPGYERVNPPLAWPTDAAVADPAAVGVDGSRDSVSPVP
jgi:hypothetical protein